MDGTVEVMDLSDGRMIRTRIGNLAKIEQPVQATQAPQAAFASSVASSDKASIFGVEEEKEEENKKEEDKDKGENRKIIIDIKPQE